MNGYYAPKYRGHDFQPLARSSTDGNATSTILENAPFSGVFDATTNQMDLASKQRRRQSFPTSLQTLQAQAAAERHMRRGSMVEFGGGNPTSHALNNFQFGQPSGTQSFMVPEASFQDISGSDKAINIQSNNTNHNQAYADMTGSGSAYHSPMVQPSPMDVDMNIPFYPQTMAMQMDYGDLSLNTMMSGGDIMNQFQPNQFTSPLIESPIPQGFTTPVESASRHEMAEAREDSKELSGSDRTTPSTTSNTRSQNLLQSQPALSRVKGVSNQNPAVQMMQNFMVNPSDGRLQQQPGNLNDVSWQSQVGLQNILPTRPPGQPSYKDAYSSTGFDMLTVLMRVATRKNPEINIGAVDLSCSFVVCDVEQHDIPIVYCSDNFERLTGYTKHEILGRNCRFLQSPSGKVQAGLKRKYVDDNSVLYLKNMISTRREAQISLINYRKGGQPFMNLLTMIPITYDTDEIKFFVGFQVDLVEQPNSVTNKNPDGTYSINYQRGLTMPRYVFPTAENNNSKLESGQTVTRDDVSTVLSTIGTEESELSKRIWDKVLLENTDDVVHVLSLKGLFMYLSPSSKKILEYDPHELVGTALSSICHPSDIVPVTRELKEPSPTSSVNIVYRIRRKHSGYMWFEGHGSLHTDQGKGRKCIILVGRERPVYTLAKSDLEAAGGVGDHELWSKLSTSGMFLFVSSHVKTLLDRQPEDMVGTSMQALMRQDSKEQFCRILELVRTGKKAELKHEMFNKRGQNLQVFSTIYPGDATEGAKPTFMVAQTRFLKYSRNTSQQKARGSIVTTKERESSTSTATLGSIESPASSQAMFSQRTPTPGSVDLSTNAMFSTLEYPMTYCGRDGLPIGHQDDALASDENVFDELKTTRSTSWQFELRQMEKSNRLLSEEVQSLLAQKKKRKRRKGAGQAEKDCANCHTRVTPEWRRGPSGNRDLCNSCGLRWAKQQGRSSPRASSQRSFLSRGSEKGGTSPKRSREQVDGRPKADSGAANAKKSTTEDKGNGHVSKAAKKDDTSANHGLDIPSKIEEDATED